MRQECLDATESDYPVRLLTSRHRTLVAPDGSHPIHTSEDRANEAGLIPAVPKFDAPDAEWRRFMCGEVPACELPQPTDADIRQRIPPERVSVAFDPGRAPPHVREAFRRAAYAAVQAWNRSLQGAVGLVEHTGSALPDVRVRAVKSPVDGGNLGVTCYAPFRRCASDHPNMADIQVAWVQRAGSEAVCVAPYELFTMIAHELGHCFWLGESASPDSIMGPAEWIRAPPAVPFLAERRVVLRWLIRAQEALEKLCREVGADRQAADALARAAKLRRVAAVEPAARLLPANDLLFDYSYAPPPVRRYWQATTQVTLGRPQSAVTSYTQALAEGLRQPEVHLRRAWVRSWLEDPGATGEFEEAVELDPTWLYARQCLVAVLADRGRAAEADRHRKVVRRLQRIDRVETRLFTATSAWSRPVYATLFRTAARCAARCATLRLRPRPPW